MNTDAVDHDGSARIARLARGLPYPSTPDIAGQVAARLTAGDYRSRPTFAPVWVAAAVLAIVGVLMAVPPVRAFVFELIGIGAVRIETGDRGGLLEFPPAEMVSLDALLSARMSLSEARERSGHALPLPAYPEDLGEPDTVYYQTLADGWVVFILWTSPEARESARMNLAVIRTSSAIGKTNPAEIVETTVQGQRAVWTRGPHGLMLPVGVEQWRAAQILVEGNVLIWEADGVTWRLESGLGMDDMRRIAESIPR